MAQTGFHTIPAAQELQPLLTVPPLSLMGRVQGRDTDRSRRKNCSVCQASDLLTAEQSPKDFMNHEERLKQIQSTKKENGAVSTKAHCFCLCLPELSTVYQNGNRWHKANAHTFSQFPTKRTDVFITCYMTAFNKM